MSGRRSRGLSDSERILWREITRSITPLRPASGDAIETEIAVRVLHEPPPRPLRPQPQAHKPKAAAPQPPALTSLGRRARQRVARGHDAIDGRLDLHGLTQAEAHDVLLRFLHAAQGRGAKVVIVITGKGRGGEMGVLRRQVPMWLAMPDFRMLVVGYEEAHQRHGGEGALYLRIRKVR